MNKPTIIKVLLLTLISALLGGIIFNLFSLDRALRSSPGAKDSESVEGITITKVEKEFTGDYYMVFNLDQTIADLCVEHECEMFAQVRSEIDYVYAGPPANFCVGGFCEVRFYSSQVDESTLGRVEIRVLEGGKLLQIFYSEDKALTSS